MSALPAEYVVGESMGESELRPMPRLTARERDLVRGVVGGLSNAQIAKQLGLREQTVRNRMSVVFQKVGVSNRLQLALEALRQGIPTDIG
jgi:DNA-binding NarL/FixJ family response regulator